jgi:hypothetical protein
MHAHLLFFVAAIGSNLPADDAPTFDPEETENVLLDEYMADALPSGRQLGLFFGNNTTTTTPAEPVDETMPLIAVAAIGGAVVLGCLLMRPTYTYETHNYDHAAESGLLDHDDYDIEAIDTSDEYDE